MKETGRTLTSNLIRTNGYVPVPQREWLEKYATERGVTMAEVIRRSIDFLRDFEDDKAAALAGEYDGLIESPNSEEDGS